MNIKNIIKDWQTPIFKNSQRGWVSLKIAIFSSITILLLGMVFLLIRFDKPMMAGLASITGANMVCSDGAETSSTPFVGQSIPNYSTFVQSYGDVSQVKYFDIYTKSTVSCSSFGGSSSFTDSCSINVCSNKHCDSQYVDSCTPQDNNCHLQEGFVTAQNNSIANWSYNCPLGCKDGACMKPPALAQGNMTVNTPVLLGQGSPLPTVTLSNKDSSTTPLDSGGIDAVLQNSTNKYLSLTLTPNPSIAPKDFNSKPYWNHWQSNSDNPVYGLSMDLKNNSDAPVSLALSASNAYNASNTANNKIADVPVIQPGETKTVLFPFVNLQDSKLLSAIGKKYGMSIAPPSIQGYVIASLHNPTNPVVFDASKIYSLNIYARPSSTTNTGVRQIDFNVSNIRVYDSNADFKARFYQIVDPFGQYIYATWPGKISYDINNPDDVSSGISALKSNATSEAQDLASNPRPANWDTYGGCDPTKVNSSKCPQLEATNYFRTQKYNGKWWMVTPSGHLFYLTGVDNVTFGYHGQETFVKPNPDTYNRSQMFTWYPQTPETGSDVLNYMYDQKFLPNAWAYGFYFANVARKYLPNTNITNGSASDAVNNLVNIWKNITAQRLASWGFNTQAQVKGLDNVPYNLMLSYSRDNRFNMVNNLPDAFDPNFKTAITSDLQTQVNPKDTYLIGYFLDNELTWAEDWRYSYVYGGPSYAKDGPEKRYANVIAALGQGQNSPIKKAFVSWLTNKYSTVAALKTSWGTYAGNWNNAMTWDDVASMGFQLPNGAKIPENSAIKSDLSGLLLLWTDQYYSTVSSVLKSLDANHLYLGSKFAVFPAEAVSSCEKYCDVVSADIYRNDSAGLPKLTNLPQEWTKDFGGGTNNTYWGNIPTTDKPWLIGEYNYSAKDHGLYGTMPTWDEVVNSDNRATNFKIYWNDLLAQPNIVGGQWYMFIDQPVTGATYEDAGQIGLIDVTDTPYQKLITAARYINKNIYGKR